MQRVSINLIIQKDYLQKVPKKGDNTDWQTIKTFLNHLGYDVKFVHATIGAEISSSAQEKVVSLPFGQNSKIGTNERALPRAAGRRTAAKL